MRIPYRLHQDAASLLASVVLLLVVFLLVALLVLVVPLALVVPLVSFRLSATPSIDQSLYQALY